MSKNYTTLDMRHIKLTGVELVKSVAKKCDEAVRKTEIWTQYNIPNKIIITRDQFKEFARLNGDEESKPTGKELFKSQKGFMFEIKVEE